MKKSIDILLIARPDHSLQIYSELQRQSKLTYLFYTFKVFYSYLRRLIRLPQAIFVSGGVKINSLATIVSYIRARKRIALFEKYSDKYLMNKGVGWLLSKVSPKLIHYWPLYSADAILNFKSRHPEVITLAEVYCPNPDFVKNDVKPVLDRLNLPSDYLLDLRILKYLKSSEAIVVPSEYVAETYRYSLPDKKYYVVPYGISIWPNYEKKYIPHKIYRFVYAGTISVEKGCDILLDFFTRHPQLEIHLYGNIACKQEGVFRHYKSWNNVYFHGCVPKCTLQNEISKYHVGIHLSRFDAYSLSVGEIIGCGIPVIVSNQTGISDLVRKHDLGIVTSLLDDEIESSIVSMTDVATYSRYVENVDLYIQSSPPSYAEAIVSLYELLLSGSCKIQP